MAKVEKIQTLHPDPSKKGVNISREKYDAISTFIMETIDTHTEISYQDLNDLAEQALTDSFQGSVPWYVVSVKLDLEARGFIERVPKTSPHVIRRKG